MEPFTPRCALSGVFSRANLPAHPRDKTQDKTEPGSLDHCFGTLDKWCLRRSSAFHHSGGMPVSEGPEKLRFRRCRRKAYCISDSPFRGEITSAELDLSEGTVLLSDNLSNSPFLPGWATSSWWEPRESKRSFIYLQNGCREVTPASPINRSKMSGFRPVPKAEGAHCRESFDSDLRPICSSISFRTARVLSGVAITIPTPAPLSLVDPSTNNPFVPKLWKLGNWESFGKYICNLMISGDKKNPKSPTSNTFPDEVIINLNVFGSSMENRIHRHVSRTHIVTKEIYR